MKPIRLVAATTDAVARIESADGREWQTALALDGHGVECVAVDPVDPARIAAGTLDRGLWLSGDGGETWAPAGDGIPHPRVLSVAFAPARRANGRSALYAGTEPSNLYRSADDGRSWETFPRLPEVPSAPGWSFPPRPWTSHVRWIAAHPVDPETLYVGIELGGVMRSRDGGTSWEDRKPASQHDAHCLATHPAAPDRLYEAAGGGVAWSDDAGATWRPADAGMDRHYTVGLAVDAADPDLWYVSATFGSRDAYRNDGQARAVIFRKRGEAPWRPLATGVLPQPLPSMPLALVAPRDRPNTLIAGLKTGDLLLSEDAGETWQHAALPISSIVALADATPAR